MPNESSQRDDSVSVAFELMRSELEAEVEAINAKGAAYFHNSDYASAREIIDQGVKLQEFCERVSRLAEEWKAVFAEEFPEEVVPDIVREARRTILSASKSSKTILLVRFPDGSTISEPKAAETLAEVIKRVGFDKVEGLGKVVNKEPLVSRFPSSNYNDTLIDGYYIKTHSSTQAKKRLLDDISHELGLGLSVGIVAA